MGIILKAENISKQYRLGTVGTGTIKDDLKRNWYSLLGKEDPFLKVGAVNDRSTKSNEDYVWALQDINFEVQQGEVLGIIGKNGAGKSTLLKILSRVTAPTTGSIKTKGRIASLLEVGTGFHPELTGRENIFLNGAILGMSKAEISRKIDEIIDFSGCERYIDTPTKRYSSGMTVRLAFAVAAHLEPEILVVDEVLAVGDAEFQKKAIGKMQEISKGEGRTVIFVSHNMAAIRNLCTRALLLEFGTQNFIGGVGDCLDRYLGGEQNKNVSLESKYLSRIFIRDANKLVVGSSASLEIDFKSFNNKVDHIVLDIYNSEDIRITTISSLHDSSLQVKNFSDLKLAIEISSLQFTEGSYYVNLALVDSSGFEFFELNEKVFWFDVFQGNFFDNGVSLRKDEGLFYVKSSWEIC